MFKRKLLYARFVVALAAVSCSSVGYRLGGVGFVFGMTGKLGLAWHGCMGGAWGAWHIGGGGGP